MDVVERLEHLEPEKAADFETSSRPEDGQADAFLPAWVTSNLRSPRSLKTLARSWAAVWISFILIIPDKSLNTLGTTAFFTVFTGLFVPASIPIQMFLILTLMLMAGILFGWGLGVAAMRAANAVRNESFLRSVYEQVQKSIASDPALRAHPEYAVSLAVFRGAFLENIPSVIYGCFLGAGAFCFGLVRAYAPKLLFLSIFGTIGLDIFCSLGPLLPTSNYTILKSVTISSASYIAIAAFLTLVIFPQTTNHICMQMVSNQLSKIYGLIALQEEILDSSPQNLTSDSPLMHKMRAAKSKMIEAQQQLSSMLLTINLEFSVGKWNGDDIKEIVASLQTLVLRAAALQNFAKLVGDSQSDTFPESPENTGNPSSSTETVATAGTNDSYLLRQVLRRRLEAEKMHSVRISDLIPVIRKCTLDLRRACLRGLEASQVNIDAINTMRWAWRADPDELRSQELQQAIEMLLGAISAFKETNRRSIVAPYLTMIREAKSKEEKDLLPLQSLYVSFVFASDLLVVANWCLQVMEAIKGKMDERRKNRLWAPKGLRMLGKVLFLRTSKEDGGFGEDEAPDSTNDIADFAYRRDPDSKPPTNVVQKIMNQIHRLWVWCRTPEAKFTFKYTIITIALWLPAVLHSSASFYYKERGIWALITAQTTLNIYAADQIYNLFSRLVGTLAGLALGLIAWYAGNGRGEGNPYGAAASIGVFLIPIIFVRIFAPPQHLASVILGCVTFALIVGYSWIDGHTNQVISLGIGWAVAWRRWVLVVIGSAATFIIMMLPPTSGRKAVRIGNARSVTELSHLYGFLTSTWISSRSEQEQTPAKWLPDFRNRLLVQAEKISILRRMTQMARWEGSIRGAWPAEEYERLVDAQSDMISSLAHLGGALGHLENNWRLTFLHCTKVLNPNFISDVMSIFILVSQSLRTGEPMHQVFPTTLFERLFYHHHRSKVLEDSEESDYKRWIDTEEVQKLEYMFYATGVVSVFQLLKCLDDLHRTTKRLCGEVPLDGFDNWRDEYERVHVRV